MTVSYTHPNWLMRCGEVFAEQKDFLTQLDTEIGDADHGLNMNLSLIHIYAFRYFDLRI